MKPLRPQKYILKLNSTYLDMYNYNINITMDEIMNHPEIVISIGHSQLLSWIEMIKGTQNDYKIVEVIRAEIKGLKRLGNTKENKKNIRRKYYELHKYQFEPDLVSIQFDKKSHFDNCCNNLVINGKHFHRLYGTPGGLKMSTVLFINQDIYSDIYTRIANGRDLLKEYVPAKLEAYMALTSSTSNAVTWPKIIVVNGTFTNFKSDVIEVRDGKDSIEPDTNFVKNKDIEIEINDGCGLMTPEYSRIINFEINKKDDTVSGVCARCAFLKGMLFTFDFKEFARDIAHNDIVIDAWGNRQNILDADVIITTSQLKLWDAYDSFQSYEDNCKVNGYDFRITKMSEALDEERNINYQFSQSYYLSDADIDELISPSINEIKDIINTDPRKSIVYLAGSQLNKNNIRFSDPAALALMINQDLINDPYIRGRIEKMIKKKIRLTKISTIDVDGNFALISGDPYGMCEDIFGIGKNGLLQAGEIYHKFWEDKGVKEVVCMRAPMCAHYNLVKQQIKYSDDADYWYRYITDCIVLNSWDTLRIAESGCDQDGDILFTTNNNILVKNHRTLPALDCQQRKAKKIISTEKDIEKSNKRSFKSNVGTITNNGTAMLNLQSNYPMYSKEWEELEYRTICIQHYQQLIIDAVKSGMKITPMNKQWTDLRECLPSENDTDEELEKKNFNKKICVYRKPYFFIYRYNTTMQKYTEYKKNADRKLKQKYGITLEELLNSKDLTDYMKKVREYYYYMSPVDLSPGTINRIAWAVNKKMSVFNSLPYQIFDKKILKSGVLYSKNDYMAVKSVYLDYINKLSSLSKNTNQDEINEDVEGIIDKHVLTSIYKSKFECICPNEEMLCDILIDLLYDKRRSKGLVWDICSETIIKNLLSKSGGYLQFPKEVNENEEFSCCRKKFVMERFCLGGESNG